jgi:two-component system osmolarity sensor histidine kinase EnvZ
MAEQLAKIEQDRAVMLAGISHDLRTPLARLRLEAEMSVADEGRAQAHGCRHRPA